jgi:ribonuclease HI
MSGRTPEIRMYTDGGCRPNPGPGGWGVVILLPGGEVRELSGSAEETTNNRMELTAAIAGLRSLEAPAAVSLYTDSEYLRKGITRWLPRWRESDWQTAGRSDVKNRDLWEELEAELERHRVGWHWVKGHAGDRWNERADALAAAAIPRPPSPVGDPGAVHLFAAAVYSGKSGSGAWAVVLSFGERERVVTGREEGTSPNRMQLAAAVAGLDALTRPMRVHLYTASDYLHDGATAWLERWKGRGWQTREGKAVAHGDLWRKLDRLMARHDVRWHVLAAGDRPEAMEQAKAAARQALKG